MGIPSEILSAWPKEQSWNFGTASETHRNAILAWMQEIAPYGVFTVDRDLVIRSWNQWLATQSGRDADDVLGRRLTDLFPEVTARRLDEHFRRALAGETSVLSTALHRYLLALPAPGDTERPMLQTARIAPLTLGKEIVGCIATVEDVTQREAQAFILRRQQEHDRLLSAALGVLLKSERPLEAAAELFPQISAPLKLEAYFNFLIDPGSTRMLLHAAGGVSPEVRKALTVADITGAGPCSRCARFEEVLYIPNVQSSAESHCELIRSIGLRSYVGFPLKVADRLLGTLSFGSYARDAIAADEIACLGTIAQYLALAIDRARRENALRAAQQSLSEHAENLEAKVAERTVRLHETIAQLESFSYTVAHDLRAPIRSLKGFSEILLSDYSETLPEGGQAIIRRLQRASHRLDALTRDLLQFSRIGRQDVKLTAVDVGEVVHDIEAVTPPLQGGVLKIVAPLPRIWAQTTLLQQCLSNLLDNALKFTPAGSQPAITVRAEVADSFSPGVPTASPFIPSTVASELPLTKTVSAPHPGPRVRVWVEDSGIGIAPQQHEKIFGIFERVSGLENVEGTGIGLAIVARAMQQMGGACGVESELGRGSRFWLEFAAAP